MAFFLAWQCDIKFGRAVMPAMLSHKTIAKAVSHSLRSLTPVTQRKPTRPNRTAAGAAGNDLLADKLVVFASETMPGGCKNFLAILASSCSDDVSITGADTDKSPPGQKPNELTSTEGPAAGTATTVAAVMHKMNMQKYIFNDLANKTHPKFQCRYKNYLTQYS